MFINKHLAEKLFLCGTAHTSVKLKDFALGGALQVLALEMVQLPPADGELHTPHAVPACFEGFKALSICFTQLRSGPHCK